ncbi:MAG: hypothetical protein ACKO96_20235, partial [Flammeovirgaceae bacterium]
MDLKKMLAMSTRSNSTSTALVIVLLIFTFPIWFAVGAALFGIMAGVIGAAVGMMGALIGLLAAAVALPFKIIFGWDSYHIGFDWNPGVWLVLLVFAAFY